MSGQRLSAHYHFEGLLDAAGIALLWTKKELPGPIRVHRVIGRSSNLLHVGVFWLS